MIIIRPLQQTDVHFIHDSWRKSLWKNEVDQAAVTWDTHFDGMEAFWRAVDALPQTRYTVAELKEVPGEIARIERQALKDENARLRLRVERLEHDLGRARRCISAERFAREQRVSELKSELRASHFGVTTLCRIAFGKAEG